MIKNQYNIYGSVKCKLASPAMQPLVKGKMKGNNKKKGFTFLYNTLALDSDLLCATKASDLAGVEQNRALRLEGV